MIKITIDGEEVYSAKDFTIKEEMLNTPSVILNNVYPISWEQDRDYISRFYHPNDYSKCLIMNNTHIPEEPGITVTSTSINADVDTSKKYEYALMGDTKQNGTPTPSSPIPIETVTGGQTISVTGKNLLNLTNGTYSANGITALVENGKITLNGTATANSFLQIPFVYEYNGTYTISANNEETIGSTTASGTYASVRINGNTYTQAIMGSKNATRTFTINQKYNDFTVRTGSGLTYNDFVIYPQLEIGSQATSFEPYREQNYKIDLGKNLATNFSNLWYSGTNKNFYTATNYRSCSAKVSPNTTYTISKKNASSRFVVIESQYPIDTTQTNHYIRVTIAESNSNRTKYTFTTTSETNYIFFGYYNGTTQSEIELAEEEIMIERGETKTSYVPYKPPIELCKVGNYQDYIRKGTGKNLWGNVPTYTRTISGFTGTQNEDGTITLSGTSTASGVSITFALAVDNGIYKKLSAGTYTISCDLASSNIWIQAFDTSDSRSLAVARSSTGASFTLTEEANVFIRIWISASGVVTDGTYLIQLEKNSEKTLYEPYGYKDKWYIYKATGKVVLDGSESTATYTNYTYFWTTTNYLRNDKGGKVYCSHFKGTAIGGTTNVNLNAWVGNASTLCFRDSTKSSLAIWKEWLNNNNVTCYYMLGTPIITEITDTELINQLESIELYNGINNIMVSGYLPSPIQLHYNYVIEEDISDLLFCGVVKNSGYISLNPRHPHYQTLQILDFKTFLSEGETLDFVIANKTIEEAIEQVISTIAPYGFIKGNIQLLNSSDVIGAYSTKDKTAYDVFNYIADITQSRWTTRLVDENTVAIDFYDPTLLPQGSPINYTQNYFEQNLIDDVSYSYGSNDYRNKQVMTSSEVYGNILQTQTIVANGYQTQFDTELKIGKISSITINGVQMTFATTQEKELGYSADFYYTPGNNFFESADLRSTGQIIIISYLAIVEGRQIITNALEIDRVATSTGRKGVVARYEDRNDATTSTELQLIGQSYIKYKGVPEIKLNVTTRKNLWNIGDRVTFNAPITELATEYMVKKKEIQRVFANPSSEEVIFYKFELSSSFNMEQAINYFDNQRAKAKGNIGEGEYITRNVDIENISNVIFYDGTCEEITLVGDNTLNSILNSPFVN